VIPLIDTLAFIGAHPLTSHRRVAGYARYAWWQIASRLRDTIVYDWVDGSKLLVRNGMTGATGNIYCGLHEFAEMGFLLHFLKAGDLFVDVGANVGSWTVLGSAVCGAEVIAAEPDPVTAAWLRRNVEINRQQGRVTIVQAALGATHGSVRLTVGRDTTNRVASEGGDGTREVELLSLDEVVADRKVSLLKMDADGYEAQIVEGAKKTLGDPATWAIVTEAADPSVADPLADFGFERMYYDPFSRQLLPEPHGHLPPPGNTLFVRNLDAIPARIATARRREIMGAVL
jgi:FkbM family methyltransferase